MGSYPSADLVYGLNLGLNEDLDEGAWPWLTDELESEHGWSGDVLEHLLKDIKGVGYATYGNLNSDYTGFALCTRAFHARAYEPKPVDIVQLTGTVSDDKALKAAWAVLYPDQVMPEPGWFIVLSYG